MVAPNAFLPDEAATLALGEALAPSIAPGLVVYLRGELGAGKTTLARGILRGLGYAGRVRSPTYALVELYELSRLNLHHFDFYRFHDPREWIDAGFRESFNGRNASLIEWPEKAAGSVPPADVEITLTPSGSGRNASFISSSLAGQKCVALLSDRWPASPSAS